MQVMPVKETQPERKAAPGRLELVRAFVNSVDYFDDEEDLPDPAALGRWLAERDLVEPQTHVSAAEFGSAIDVREGLRAVLQAHNGGELDTEAVGRLDEAATRAGLNVRFSPEPALEPQAGGVDGALARLLGLVAQARADGNWDRRKACAHDPCAWAFYDQSKNRSKRWCRMDTCGNIEKARAHRARQRPVRARQRG
jgi:predicted RNA-binding Zn ribbon-like protein